MTPNNLQESNADKIVIEQDTVVTPSATVEKKTSRVIKRRKSGIFDVPEIIAVSLGGLLIFLVAITYIFWLLPARERVRQRELSRNQMEKNLKELQEKIGVNKSTESRVGDIIGSVDRFENNFLTPGNLGNSSLYGRLNELIRTKNLRNTAGPEYAPLEAANVEKLEKDERSGAGRGKFQSLYPGTGVSVTVEGSYASLRRFISDLENSRQFVVINSMEIESNGETSTGGSNTPATTNNVSSMSTSGIPSEISGIPNTPNSSNPNRINPRAPQIVQPQPTVAPKPAPVSRPRGSVSMRLELAAYFRRNVAPQMSGYDSTNNQTR
jgi:hypothetical protein